MRDLAALACVVLLAPLSISCDARRHLAGETRGVADAGDDLGAEGDGAATDTNATDGLATSDGAPTSDGGVDATPPVPVPLAISPRDALTRVAHVLWEAPPSADLVAMADAGLVVTDADVRKLARAMLDDPRARVGVASFYRWWLRLDGLASVFKDQLLFPEFTTDVAKMTAAETEAFGLHVTLDADGRFPTLMLASYSFLNESLARLYGVSGVTGPELRLVDLDPTQRAGVFTQLSFLAMTASGTTWTSPSRRGIFLNEVMLCRPIPVPPPDTIPPVLPGNTAAMSARQTIQALTADAACQGCHGLFDPIGFAYEGFDSIGRFRLEDNGVPIDATGDIRALDSGPVTFDGPIELGQALARLPEARRCMAQKWLEYALARALTDTDPPSVTGAFDLFAASNLDLRALIAATLASDSFLSPTGGPPCTPGLAQTCNDDPRVSSLHGTCSAGAKCVCAEGYSLNPATGRCL